MESQDLLVHLQDVVDPQTYLRTCSRAVIFFTWFQLKPSIGLSATLKVTPGGLMSLSLGAWLGLALEEWSPLSSGGRPSLTSPGSVFRHTFSIRVINSMVVVGKKREPDRS